MRLQKITLSFRPYSDADFLKLAVFILKSMTGNPAFTDPIPTIAEVQAGVTNYSEWLSAASGLGRNNVAQKTKARFDLEALLQQLGMYVMYVANGDAAILTSSGYMLTKMPEPSYISNPGNVTLKNGVTSGELVDLVKNVDAARVYFHEISDTAPTEATVWTRNQSSKARFVFTALTPGKQYWVRVAAVGSGEQLAYSSVATQFVQ